MGTRNLTLVLYKNSKHFLTADSFLQPSVSISANLNYRFYCRMFFLVKKWKMREEVSPNVSRLVKDRC